MKLDQNDILLMILEGKLKTQNELNQVCINNTLSENAIIKLKDKWDWYYVFNHQYITKKIIELCSIYFVQNIDFELIMWLETTKENLSEEFIEQHIISNIKNLKNWDWQYIFSFTNVSNEYLKSIITRVEYIYEVENNEI